MTGAQAVAAAKAMVKLVKDDADLLAEEKVELYINFNRIAELFMTTIINSVDLKALVELQTEISNLKKELMEAQPNVLSV